MLYDLNGNRTGKNGTRSGIDGKQEEMAVSYCYDAMNRQTYVKTLDGKEQENFYDGEGLTENGKRTTFLFHNGEILTECGGSGKSVSHTKRCMI